MQQLSVFVKNELGTMAEITGALEKGGFNIRAFSVYDTPDFGILRLIADRTEEAYHYLTEEGFFCRLTEVIALPLEDRPGMLHEILLTLREAKVHVDYMYSIVISDTEIPMIILATEEMEEAKEALGLCQD